MSQEAAQAPPAPLARKRPAKVLVARHSLAVRITHWINVLSLVLLLFSGLQIFNAHPALYWGQASDFSNPWLSMRGGDGVGMTYVAGREFDTSGLFGFSGGRERGFPGWLTLPSDQNLALGRNWHLFFAWVFGVNGLIYILTGFLSRHFLRDLAPTGADARGFFRDALHHLTFHTQTGQAATRYIGAQKLLYLGMIFLVLPLIILTGMTMSPGLNAAFPFLLDLFGGRQSARSIHFICATLIVLFVVIHVLMVLLTGPINQLRGMITGKYAIVPDERESAP